MRSPLFLALLFVTGFAHAVPAPIQVKPGSVAKASAKGFFAGGEATGELSLIEATAAAKADGTETLDLFYGSHLGQKLKGLPGFFQVVLDREGRRVSIDLSQVVRTAIDPAVLRKKLKSSKLVSMIDMTMDPSDSSTNITLILKKPIEIAIESSDASSPSRLSLTMKPIEGAKK